MAGDLFDLKLRAQRRDRAFRRGPQLFLHERAFDDCLDRLSIVTRTFTSALLIGCPNPDWPERLRERVASVDVLEPGPLFAAAASGEPADEDHWAAPPGAYDLSITVGTLDTVNDLPRFLRSIRAAMADDSLLIGAVAGGDSLPKLRAAMFAADRVMGSAAPHVHPRIDGPTLATLLSGSGFVMPVVDVDRVSLSYASLSGLVSDLRAMGATNILRARSRRPIVREAMQAAERAFANGGDRTVEQLEILHFAAWTPAVADRG